MIETELHTDDGHISSITQSEALIEPELHGHNGHIEILSEKEKTVTTHHPATYFIPLRSFRQPLLPTHLEASFPLSISPFQFPSNMSRPTSLSNTIHIRDFID